MTAQRTCEQLGFHEWIVPRTKWKASHINWMETEADDLKRLAITLECVKCKRQVKLSGAWQQTVEEEKATDAPYIGDLNRVYYSNSKLK